MTHVYSIYIYTYDLKTGQEEYALSFRVVLTLLAKENRHRGGIHYIHNILIFKIKYLKQM